MSESRLNRRELLGRGAVAAVGIAGAGAVSGGMFAQTASGEPTISGTVIGAAHGGAPLVVDHEGKRITIRALPGAHIWLDHKITIDEFAKGDEVAAVGHWDGEKVFAAHQLTPLFTPIAGIVTSVHGNEVTVQGVVVIVDKSTRFRRSADSRLEWLEPRMPQVGASFSALARRDAKSGRLMARQVYIAE